MTATDCQTSIWPHELLHVDAIDLEDCEVTGTSRPNAVGVFVLFSINLELTLDRYRSCHKVSRLTRYHFDNHTIEQGCTRTKTTFLIVPYQDKLVDIRFLEQGTGQDIAPQFYFDTIEFLDFVSQ